MGGVRGGRLHGTTPCSPSYIGLNLALIGRGLVKSHGGSLTRRVNIQDVLSSISYILRFFLDKTINVDILSDSNAYIITNNM